MNYGDIVRRNAKRFPDKPAVIFQDQSITWKELNLRVNCLSNWLLSKYLAGDRVAIIGPNCPQFLDWYFATAKAGMISAPLSYRLLPRDIAGFLDHSGAHLLAYHSDYSELVEQVRDLVGTGVDFLPIDRVAPNQGVDGGFADDSIDEPTVRTGGADPFALFYTSGTTGLPKGAVVSHRNLESNAYNQMVADRSSLSDINLIATPLYHMGAVFVATTYMMLGCTQVMVPHFRPQDYLCSVQDHRVTVSLLIPTMLNMVLNHPEFGNYDLSSLRLLFYGGSSMPRDLLVRAIKDLGCSFTQGYGLTETLEATFLLTEDHVLDGSPGRERRLASAGREAVGAEVKIVDDDDLEVPRGQVGEILVKSDSVIQEYWRNPELTAETIKGGWFHTGDLGYVDDGGYFFVVDRKKDMVISGGTNIYTREVEEVLYGHPAVLEAAVIGVPDPLWGESIKAVVVLKQGSAATEEDLLECCRENLAGYKKPRSIDFVDELPKNPSGKILKHVLREQYRHIGEG